MFRLERLTITKKLKVKLTIPRNFIVVIGRPHSEKRPRTAKSTFWMSGLVYLTYIPNLNALEKKIWVIKIHVFVKTKNPLFLMGSTLVRMIPNRRISLATNIMIGCLILIFLSSYKYASTSDEWFKSYLWSTSDLFDE